MNSPVTMDKPSAPRPSGARHSWLNRLYTGTGVLDVVGNRRRWYLITAGIVLVCLTSMAVRGFTFGIDFVGGSRIQLPAGDVTTEQLEIDGRKTRRCVRRRAHVREAAGSSRTGIVAA